MINKAWFSKFMIAFGYFMAVIYVGLGSFLLSPWAYPGMAKEYRYLKITFALFFIAYGLFRLVKMYSSKKEPKE
jgi:hypothetical protein